MGTVPYYSAPYAPSRGQAAATISGAYKTSGSATTNASTAVSAGTVEKGDIFRAYPNEAVRVRYDGTDPDATTGIYGDESNPIEFEAHQAGTVKIIDVA